MKNISTLTKSPGRIFFYTAGWIVLLTFFRLQSRATLVLFPIGGLLGAYLWEYESEINNYFNKRGTYSSLRNILTQVVLGLVALYALTSSSSLIASGFANGLYGASVFDILVTQRAGGSIDDWFWPIGGASEEAQRWYARFMASLLIVMSLIALFF